MQKNVSFQKGFTLLEILISTAIVAVISMISTSAYNGYIETAKISQAENQIKALSFLIDDYAQEHGEYPQSLADIGNAHLKDPWGNGYIYLNLRSGNGVARGNGNEPEYRYSSSGGFGNEGEFVPRAASVNYSSMGGHDGSGSYNEMSEHDGSSDGYDESSEESDRINIGAARKDGNMVPINTNYDLCSPGKDGKTKAPLRAKVSQDDIIYANDGDYIGLASKF